MACYHSNNAMAFELIVLFVEGQPVVYEVEKKRNRFLFTPLTSWKEQTETMGFVLQKINDKWNAIGVQDRNIIDQAVEEVERRTL